MNRPFLRIILIATVVAVVAPMLLYLVTGPVIGVLLPCGSTGVIGLITHQGETVSISCAVLRTVVTAVITAGGTIPLVLGVFMLGIAEVVSESRSTF